MTTSVGDPSDDLGLPPPQGSTVGRPVENDEDETLGEEEEDDADTGDIVGDGLTSKQRKKKKSKATAKLRKKLGLAPSTSASPVEAAASSIERDLPDDVVDSLRSAVATEHGQAAGEKVNRANLAKVLAAMNLERNVLMKNQGEKMKGSTQKEIRDHKFWKTQPVTKPDDTLLQDDGAIEPNQPPEKVRQEPYPLPSEFEWSQVDIDDQEQLKEVYELLCANYVEDDDSSLRFKYSPEFLNWVLRHPGYKKTWHISVRVKSTNKMVAFISGIPHELRVRDQSYHSTEINFLCVHKKLRSKRLTPVLIKEVTRACHLTGVFHAIYTAGIVIPTPMSCARYYHRTLNPKKLIDIGFAAVPQGMSHSAYFKRYELPKFPRTKGLREMRSSDVRQVGKLLRRFLRKYDMAPRFSDEEVQHVLLSGRGTDVAGKREGQVTWAYVVEDETGKITDLVSFYSLPSSVLNHPEHKELNAAYLFYYATDIGFNAFSDESAAEASTSSRPAASTLSKAVDPPSTEGLAPWQRSHISALNAAERQDEHAILRWDHETKEAKDKIKRRLNELVNDLLIIAKQHDFDVVNCLTVMDNPLFLTEQKFGPGDGFLRFYLFNWRVKPIHGGMGGRPGEAEMDPVAQYLNAQVKTSGNVDNADLSRALRARLRPDEMGSGLGVVMV